MVPVKLFTGDYGLRGFELRLTNEAVDIRTTVLSSGSGYSTVGSVATTKKKLLGFLK